jgi:hypothetical protein
MPGNHHEAAARVIIGFVFSGRTRLLPCSVASASAPAFRAAVSSALPANASNDLLVLWQGFDVRCSETAVLIVAAASLLGPQGAWNDGNESREKLGQRIDQAQVAVSQAATDAQEKAGQAGDSARSKWAQLRADAAGKADDVKAKVDKRGRQLDAKAAASDADWAESEAAEALALAVWAIDNSQLAALDAIDARARADELAKVASS